MLCNLQIFSGCVCHLEQLHAQSPFLSPIVFSINLIPLFDIGSVLAVLSPWVVRVCAALLGLLGGRNSCCLWFWQLVFGVSLRDATSNLPSSPNPLSNRSVLHDERKHKTVVSSQPNALREEARHTNLPLLAIGCHADCSGERRTSPFNGIESLLSRAVVIKTKSLPVSATTFPTALSLYIAHDRRKHKHNPTLCANKHVVQMCRSSLSAAADGLADGSGERRTSPVNGTERSLSRAVQYSQRLCPSPLHVPRFQQRCLCTLLRTLAKGCPLSKLFSKAKPVPFEKEININLVCSSCLKPPNEMLLGDPRQADQRTQSFHFAAIIHQSLDPAARSSAQAPSSLSLHELRALDKLRTRRRVGSR